MSYEAIMEGRPDLQSGFNLVVCYFALGDKEKMKKGFAKLLSIKSHRPPPRHRSLLRIPADMLRASVYVDWGAGWGGWE